MYDMSHLHNRVLLFCGQTDSWFMHRHPQPPGRVYTPLMQAAAHNQIMHKKTCTYMNPVLQEKFLPLWWVTGAAGDRNTSTNMSLCAPSKNQVLGVTRGKRTADLYFAALSQINLKLWTWISRRCLQRWDKPSRSSCVHKEGYRGY